MKTINKDYTLFNNDATVAMNELLENNVQVDCIITDPPYGVEFKQSFYDDSKDYVFSQIDGWYKGWYDLLKENKYLFVFVPTKEIHNWIIAGIKAGFNYKNILTTEAHFIGRSFRQKNNFEFKAQPILVFSKGKGQDFNEFDLIKTSESWLKDKRNNNPKPYTYIYPNIIGKDIVFANVKSTAQGGRHPNQKEVELLQFLVGIATNERDTVLDTFNGSGSTGEASLLLNRKYIGVEQDKKYYEATIKRLNGDD